MTSSSESQSSQLKILHKPLTAGYIDTCHIYIYTAHLEHCFLLFFSLRNTFSLVLFELMD